MGREMAVAPESGAEDLVATAWQSTKGPLQISWVKPQSSL